MKRRSLYSAVYAAAYNSFATASPQKRVQQRQHGRWKQAARRAACLPIVFAALLAAAGGSLAADKSAKIGVLTDLSGPYSDLGGLGSVVAAEMAVNDSGLRGKGWSVTVVAADHMNKPDVGVNAVRKWLEADDVDAIADVNNSGVALAVNAIIKERNGVYLASGSATSDLTGKACTPNTIQWTYDTYEFASGTGRELTRAGGKSWFFISADYAFGAALERDASEVIRANGGHVTGSVKHPLNAGDFSSWLLQAQASKADIIGLANAGSDVHNAIKQAVEFGIPAGGQKLAALFFLIADVQALGLEKTQGLFVTETFYWDLNAGTRAFAKRFAQKAPKHFMPTMIQAGAYSAVLHYLKALEALGSNPHDGAKAVAQMKRLQTEDPLFGKGSIRADGRKLHPAYLFEVKSPAESKYPWDYYKLVATIPADEAFRPLAQSECRLINLHARQAGPPGRPE